MIINATLQGIMYLYKIKNAIKSIYLEYNIAPSR